MIIDPSAEERRQQQLSSDNLTTAVRHIRERGYAIIASVVEPQLVADLAAAYHALPAKERTSLPLRPPFSDPAVLANPFALQVMQELLVERLNICCGFFHVVTPDADRQGHIHRDRNHLFPESGQVLPPHAIGVDIPLIDFTEENGATALWPGTHKVVDRYPEEARYLPERAASFPRVQAVMPAGSLLFRDMRMWHASMPNHTEDVRVMIDLTYIRLFARYLEHMALPEETWEQLPKDARKLLRAHAPQEA